MTESCLDIVIVNWNSGAFLRSCIQSIQNFGGAVVGTVVVVDNGSADGSCEGLSDVLPSIRIISPEKNLGFAGGCNLGASHCSSSYVLFLNPDTELKKDTLLSALQFMESSEAKNIGICGVKLVDREGRTQRCCARFPSPRMYVGKSFGLEGRPPSIFPNHFMVEFDHEISRVVDQVMGAFFLVRREVFDKLKGFDERFFVYFEEVDFSLRAHLLGWKTWYMASCSVYHRGGGTTDSIPARRLFYSLRSRIQYAQKNFSMIGASIMIGAAIFVEPLTRLTRALMFRFSPREAIAILAAYRMTIGAFYKRQ